MFPDVQPQFFLLQFMLLRRVHSLSLRVFLFDSCGHVFSAEMAAGFHALINQTLQNRIDGPSYLNRPLQTQLRNLLSVYRHQAYAYGPAKATAQTGALCIRDSNWQPKLKHLETATLLKALA